MWTILVAVVAYAEPACPETLRDGVHVEHTVERGRLRRGERDGRWCTYAPYGRLIEEQHWDRGVPDGPYYAWGAYEARTAGAYDDGQQHGEWTVWGPAGAIDEHGTYDHGLRVGSWQEHGAEGAYVDGLREGLWTEPTPYGRREVTYRDGLADGLTREWDAYDWLIREETFARGVPEGPFHTVAGGIDTRGSVHDGKYDGEWTVTDAQGVREHGVYVAGERHGAWETREDGQWIERTWDHGLQDGPVRVWSGGVLLQEASYRDGQPDGTWTYFHSGVPERRITYVAGVLEGPFTAWSAGDVVEEGMFQAGYRQGPWREVGVEGEWRGEYDLGAKNGVWRVESDVPVHEIGWDHDRKHGIERLWAAGTLVDECAWKDGQQDGVCTRWAADGTLRSRSTWSHGVPDGVTTEWHENGVKSFEANYAEGQADGPCTQWHDNGRIAAKGSYAAGIEVGAWEWHHPTGAVERSGTFDANGVMTGTWTERYADGTLANRGAYAQGARTGTWSFWYPSGQLEKRGDYADDFRTGEWTFWYPNGVVAKQGLYVSGARNGRWTFRFPTGGLRTLADYALGDLVAIDPKSPVATGDPDPMPDDEDRVIRKPDWWEPPPDRWDPPLRETPGLQARSIP